MHHLGLELECWIVDVLQLSEHGAKVVFCADSTRALQAQVKNFLFGNATPILARDG